MSIDNIMNKFKGILKQTFHTNNKPVKEGYKLWEICYSVTGFPYKMLLTERV